MGSFVLGPQVTQRKGTHVQQRKHSFIMAGERLGAAIADED